MQAILEFLGASKPSTPVAPRTPAKSARWRASASRPVQQEHQPPAPSSSGNGVALEAATAGGVVELELGAATLPAAGTAIADSKVATADAKARGPAVARATACGTKRETESTVRASSPLMETLLTEAQLESFVRAHPRVMVEVTTRGCKACTKIMPTVIDLLLAERGVRAARVDVAFATSWCDLHDVARFPTFLFFSGAAPLPALTVQGARPTSLAESVRALAAL
jgi:Thioredoxin